MSALPSLLPVYERLREWDSLEGTHVSLDHDRRGDEYVQVISDWIEGDVLADLLTLAREFGVELTSTAEGVRFDRPDGERIQAVEQVKRILDGEESGDEPASERADSE